MPLRAYAIIIGFFLVTTGCRSADNPPVNPANVPATNPATMVTPPATAPTAPAASTVKAKVDVCGLLTSDDLKSVQGEPLKEAQRSDRRDGAFIVAQCYFALPTTSNSVVLNVTTAGEAQGANNPRKFWEDTFGGEDAKDGDREKERERAKKDKPAAGEEEEEGARPERVNGVGEEAFWLASRVGGALYVLKKDVFFRISVGGAGDEKAKLKKSKTLAQQVLKKI